MPHRDPADQVTCETGHRRTTACVKSRTQGLQRSERARDQVNRRVARLIIYSSLSSSLLPEGDTPGRAPAGELCWPPAGTERRCNSQGAPRRCPSNCPATVPALQRGSRSRRRPRWSTTRGRQRRGTPAISSVFFYSSFACFELLSIVSYEKRRGEGNGSFCPFFFSEPSKKNTALALEPLETRCPVFRTLSARTFQKRER